MFFKLKFPRVEANVKMSRQISSKLFGAFKRYARTCDQLIVCSVYLWAEVTKEQRDSPGTKRESWSVTPGRNRVYKHVAVPLISKFVWIVLRRDCFKRGSEVTPMDCCWDIYLITMPGVKKQSCAIFFSVSDWKMVKNSSDFSVRTIFIPLQNLYDFQRLFDTLCTCVCTPPYAYLIVTSYISPPNR